VTAARVRFGTTEVQLLARLRVAHSVAQMVVSLIIFDGLPGRGSPVFSAKSTRRPGCRINVDAFGLGRVLGFG